MAKKFKFEFERGGVLIADACEEAPITVKLFEEQCPRTMEIMHCVSACHEITTDDIPSSAPIPEEILVEHPDKCVRIPMNEEIRSLNLSNSAAIILYEALRQNEFKNMQKEGQLHRLSW